MKPCRLLAALTACLMAVPCSAASIAGPARVIDGDTLVVDGHRLRLAGIDAPESRQRCRTEQGGAWPCGEAAAGALASLLLGVEVECTIEGRDRYGRELATCRRGAVDVNRWMVERGFALAYRRYSQRYAAAEEDAREHGRAIWRTEFTPPWVWRAQAKQSDADLSRRIDDLQRQLDALKAEQDARQAAREGAVQKPPAQAGADLRSCCKRCRTGIPCGNSCIAADKTCRQPPGCAC